MEDAPPLISVVTPLFNEAGNVAILGRRLREVFQAHPEVCWEWIAVDDGSTDGTGESLQAALLQVPRWQSIRLSRNFGQQAALRAGLDSAEGDAVVLLDADLQDPPERDGRTRREATGCQLLTGNPVIRHLRGSRITREATT